jgi:hypothetical protein
MTIGDIQKIVMIELSKLKIDFIKNHESQVLKFYDDILLSM